MLTWVDSALFGRKLERDALGLRGSRRYGRRLRDALPLLFDRLHGGFFLRLLGGGAFRAQGYLKFRGAAAQTL